MRYYPSLSPPLLPSLPCLIAWLNSPQQIVAAIEEKNATMVSFLTRDVLTLRNDYNAALNDLSNGVLIADVYYILAGTRPGQGAVITRNRQNATDVWQLNSPSQWYVLETNYDHWEQPPWFDDRVVPAENALKAIGQVCSIVCLFFFFFFAYPSLVPYHLAWFDECAFYQARLQHSDHLLDYRHPQEQHLLLMDQVVSLPLRGVSGTHPPCCRNQ